jgi:hypothetical protein
MGTARWWWRCSTTGWAPVIEQRKLGELLPKSGYAKLRKLDRRFVWLEGVLGVPGKEPRVNDRNQVEFETVEPKAIRLGFQE